MLTMDQKQAIVAEVAQVARGAQSAVAAEYRGLSVGQMTKLRMQARSSGVYLRVVKNTLARRAVEGTGYACMQESLIGPLVLAFSSHEPSAAAKLVSEFAKGNDKLVVKVVAVSGRLLSPADLATLAKMPTRDEALATLMAVMKAPIEKFVRTLAAPASTLVRAFAAVRDQKQAHN